MQTNKTVEKFGKKKPYEPAGEEIRKRKKADHRTGSHKFKNKFLNNDCVNSLSYSSLYE